MAHAILSPSSASRWLNCTPSARFEQQFPDRGNVYANEGTLAHSLGELLIRDDLKLISKPDFKKKLKALQAHELYTPSMLDHCEDYAGHVVAQYYTAQKHTKDALIFLEQRLNMSDYVPEGFGTGDVIIVADTVADFTDLKYGKGVPVSAVENRQLMLYALGILREFDHIYDIRTVRMTIYQPRIDNISTWEIETVDLLHWAETELKPRAALAFAGKGNYQPGNHCQFCKARAVCEANAEFQLELAKHDFKDANRLTDADISEILTRAKAFENWLSDVKEYALTEALNGKKWPGYKLVEGRSNRKYSDEEIVAGKLTEAGFPADEIFKPRSLVGITEMEKVITKKTFKALLEEPGLVVKPEGKATLAPESDKRPELNSLDAAKQDFEEAI
jgi:hypothetical protein